MAWPPSMPMRAAILWSLWAATISSAVVAKTEVVGVGGDDIGADGVDHLKGAVGGVVVLDVLGTNIDGEELCAEEALHAREISLARPCWAWRCRSR